MKFLTAIKILAEQFGIKLSIAELLPALLKSRVAWAVVVALVVQFNGCKAARDSWYEGYAKGCKECGNGQVEPSPDGEGWYPFKHFRRFIFGTGNLQSPPTDEDWAPPTIENHTPVTEGETLEAPQAVINVPMSYVTEDDGSVWYQSADGAMGFCVKEATVAQSGPWGQQMAPTLVEAPR